MLTRRTVLGGLAASTLCPVLPTWAQAALPAGIPASNRIAFKVSRKGDEMGQHVLTFGRDGQDLTVNVAIDLKVTILSVPVFRYTHRIAERWRDGRLVALETSTDDDGKKMTLRGAAAGDSFKAESGGKSTTYPADILATSWWNPVTLQAKQIMHTHDGELLQVDIAPKGQAQVPTAAGPVSAAHYTVSGKQPLELWYDTDKRLARIRFAAQSDGSIIDYLRV